MTIVYAVIRTENRSLVMVSKDRSLTTQVVKDLRYGLNSDFSVVPVTLGLSARFAGYRRLFLDTSTELKRIGAIG